MQFRIFLAAALALGGLTASHVASAAPDADDLTALSLEELLSVEVTSVSRKRQSLARTAASVYVVTGEDIRRSGAQSIPEILRLVPGLQVAQIDSSRYAITARGSNLRFGNKLLVLMDGRTLYSPLFAGVFWSVQDTDLESIERIEVIRGPGATLWGANAVNGVINIITRSARDTLGSSLGGGLYAESGGFGHAIVGGELGAETQYRLFAKYFDRPGTKTLDGGDHGDRWRQRRAGLRVDSGRPGDSLLSLTGEIYRGSTDTLHQRPVLAPPYQSIEPLEEEVRGGHLLLRWTLPISSRQNLVLQTFYDRNVRRSSHISFEQRTLEVDLQHQFTLSERTDLVWGVGYRLDNDEIEETDELSATPAATNYALISGFVQAEWQLVPDRWSLSLGTKLEDNEFSGFEWQPSVRTAYMINDSATLWVSASRAVRTPSRGEMHASIVGGVLEPLTPQNPLPVPLQLQLLPSPEMRPETSLSYEAGYRTQFRSGLSMDLSLFLTEYDDLRGVAIGQMICPSGQPVSALPPCFLVEPYVILETNVSNEGAMTATGGELTFDWRVGQDLDVEFGASWVDENLEREGVPLSVISGFYPPYQLFATVGRQFGERFRADVTLRRADELENGTMDGWTAADLRLEFRHGDHLRVALSGRHLGAGRHQQFVSELGDIAPALIEPSAYAEISWQF